MDIPTEADEDWRYGRIDALDLGELTPIASRRGEGRAVGSSHSESFLSEIGAPVAVVRTLDGVLVSTELGGKAAHPKLRCGSLTELDHAPLRFGSILRSLDDAFIALADAFFPDAVVIEVAAGSRIEQPIVIVHEVSASDGRHAVFPRTFVALGEGAEATVVEYLVSSGGSHLVIPHTELDVGQGAHLGYHGVQELGRSTWQLGYLSSSVQRDGELRSFTAALGGDYSRLSTRSALDGENASSELLAAYFANGSQVQDMRTFQEHVAPRTRSRLIFKGAVDDDARSVYSGLIHIHKGARKSDAAQTNRNLVLSERAHADSVPNLDIEENDVRCSHASAVGPIDREQRYYVESRGVPPKAAERLILLGFFDDLITRAPEAGVARYLRGVIAERLEPKDSEADGAGS